jgi:FkbM family methyltransferase
MNIQILPIGIRRHLQQAINDLGIEENMIDFWEVSDYGIFVLLTESFYKKLQFRKAEPVDFMHRRISESLPYAGSYSDSRAYIATLVNHFIEHGLNPCILDVGGYIGRFSLEAALFVQKMNLDIPIHCFEPGLTGNIIKTNLAVNGVGDLVSLRNEAASNENAIAEYKYARHVLISGRICSFPSATHHRTVKTKRLDSVLGEIGCNKSAIIKIDTEGHEPSVMEGLGSLIDTLQMVCIVEFWPATLQQTVNGMSYADYIEKNFVVLNIRSSLYPKFYELIPNIRKFADEFKAEEGNVDLLFISKKVVNVDKLVTSLRSLSR